MKIMEELSLLSYEELYEKLDHEKRKHYQFLCDLDLSNVSKDELQTAFEMMNKVKHIDYVFGQKLCDHYLLKQKNWSL